jgi:6-phosphogluconolactonase (cycloisomerase 2 family)
MAMPLPAGSGLDGDFLVPDLGSDTVWLVDRMGAKRAAWRGRTGDGPRHLAPLPGGGWLLLNELSGDAARLRPSGGTPEETARLALADHPALGTPSGAAIKLLPGTDRPGNCLALASLRGAYDAIVALRATGDGLALAARSPLPASGPLACRGPRDFAFAPGGLVLVAGQRDHAIASFRLDPASGALAATGHAVACPSPVCLLALA